MFKLTILRKNFNAKQVRKLGNKIIENLGSYKNINSIEITCGYIKLELLNESLINDKSLKKRANYWKKNDHILLEINKLKPQQFINCYELFDEKKNFKNSVSYIDINCHRTPVNADAVTSDEQI